MGIVKSNALTTEAVLQHQTSGLGFEQDIAEYLLVDQQEWIEFVREGEYEMEVAPG
jgi:hypothetical protein